MLPVTQYGHASGCSVTGGYVYRGSKLPSVRGRYLDGDYCSGTVWSLRVIGGKAQVRREPFRVESLSSFGEDATGELYLVSLDGPGVPARRLTRATAQPARRRTWALAERGVRERVERLVQVVDLATHLHEPVVPLESAVDPLELRRDAIEPFEQRVELAVGEVVRLHCVPILPGGPDEIGA